MACHYHNACISARADPSRPRLIAPRSASRLRCSPRRRPFSLGRDALRRRQRGARPGDKLIGFVEQTLRRAPKGEVDGIALFLVVERRKGLGFLELRPIVVVDLK